MATSQQFLVYDNSTLANFKSWAQAISNFFTTAGWIQSTDTGQVNWGTIVSVPGSGAYVYEIWKPNDGLTVFYVKVEYGNNGGTNNPAVRITISTTTNGSGTATGSVVGPYLTRNSMPSGAGATTYECNLSGALGRMGAMMWRNGTSGQQFLFAIERSLDSTGAYTSAHVTLYYGGPSGNAPTTAFLQQTLHLTSGAAPATAANSFGGLVCLAWPMGSTSAFNGSMAFATCQPMIGFFDLPCTVLGLASQFDGLVEGITFSTTLYGSTRTYMPSKLGPFQQAGPSYNNFFPSGILGIAMRYD